MYTGQNKSNDDNDSSIIERLKKMQTSMIL